MGLGHLQYERGCRIVYGLRAAMKQLQDVGGEAWMELPEDDPLRDIELDEAIQKAQAALLRQCIKAESALPRLRATALKER